MSRKPMIKSNLELTAKEMCEPTPTPVWTSLEETLKGLQCVDQVADRLLSVVRGSVLKQKEPNPAPEAPPDTAVCLASLSEGCARGVRMLESKLADLEGLLA